jgi:hypothetical protein
MSDDHRQDLARDVGFRHIERDLLEVTATDGIQDLPPRRTRTASASAFSLANGARRLHRAASVVTPAFSAASQLR